jgi:Protein kinase domain/FHA domain
MNLWCDDRIIVTVDGPQGPRKLTVARPFARVGSHPNSEIVLGEEVGERAYYLHGAAGGIYALRLDPDRESTDDRGRWLGVAEPITLGPYRLTARLKSQGVAPPNLPSLIAAGSADLPLPVLNVLSGSEFHEKRRLDSTLTLVGRHPACTLRLRGRKTSMLHCVLVWDQRRLWCIDLFSSNGTLLNGRRIDFADLQLRDQLTAGEFSLVYYRWSPRASMTPGWQPDKSHARADKQKDGLARSSPAPSSQPERKPLWQEPPAPASKRSKSVDEPLPSKARTVRTTLVSPDARFAAAQAETPPAQPPIAPAPQPRAIDPVSLPANIDLRPGADPIPGFTLDCSLGEGTCGSVWKATAPGGIPIALKFVPLAGRNVELKMREIQIAKTLRHPNLVSIFSTWQSPDWIVIAMELADRTLMDRYEEAAAKGLPGIPRDELLEYMRDAAKGIDYLNDLHVQNRDIKPSNLLLVGGAVKIADFGTARSLHGSVTHSRCLGTPAYAAPEYLLNKTSNRSDQYSLAVTYCELRGGRLPFDGSVVEVYQAHLNKPPDLGMLPEPERPAVAKALSKKPRDRWPSCRAFIDALATSPLPKSKWWQPFAINRSQRKS